MSNKKDSAAITVQAGNCPRCGKHNITAKYFQNEDKTITQTIACDDCGFSIRALGKNRYRASRDALIAWGFAEGYGPKKLEKLKENPNPDMKVKIVEPVVKEEKKPASNFNRSSRIGRPKADSITEDKKILLSEQKKKLLTELKTLIAKFEKNNPKEECPVTLGDLLKVYGFTNEEIASVLATPKSKKKFLKTRQEVIYYLNKGISVYTRDREGTVFKYTPIKKLEDNQETMYMFDAIGFSNYAFVLINN